MICIVLRNCGDQFTDMFERPKDLIEALQREGAIEVPLFFFDRRGCRYEDVFLVREDDIELVRTEPFDWRVGHVSNDYKAPEEEKS